MTGSGAFARPVQAPAPDTLDSGFLSLVTGHGSSPGLSAHDCLLFVQWLGGNTKTILETRY